MKERKEAGSGDGAGAKEERRKEIPFWKKRWVRIGGTVALFGIVGWLLYHTWAETKEGYERTIAAHKREIVMLKKRLSECEKGLASLKEQNDTCRSMAQLVVKRSALRDRISMLLTLLSGKEAGAKVDRIKDLLIGIDEELRWEARHSKDGFESYLYALLDSKVKDLLQSWRDVSTEDATALDKVVQLSRSVVSNLKKGLPLISIE